MTSLAQIVAILVEISRFVYNFERRPKYLSPAADLTPVFVALYHNLFQKESTDCEVSPLHFHDALDESGRCLPVLCPVAPTPGVRVHLHDHGGMGLVPGVLG